GDAGVQRLARAGKRHWLAVHHEIAAGRPMHARKRLDQRRLAGAVVAQQAVHFAGLDDQRNARQGDDGAKMLAQVVDLDQRAAPALRPGLVPRGNGLRRSGHPRSPVTRRRIELLNRTAINSMAPRNTWNQSLGAPVKRMPIWTTPKISAPRHAPTTEP